MDMALNLNIHEVPISKDALGNVRWLKMAQ